MRGHQPHWVLLPSSRPDPCAISLARDLAADRAVHLSAERFEALGAPPRELGKLPQGRA